MRITLELDLHSQEATPLLTDPYGCSATFTWRVVDHDFTMPDHLPDTIDSIIHRIEPIRLSRSYTPTISWEGTLCRTS